MLMYQTKARLESLVSQLLDFSAENAEMMQAVTDENKKGWHKGKKVAYALAAKWLAQIVNPSEYDVL